MYSGGDICLIIFSIFGSLTVMIGSLMFIRYLTFRQARICELNARELIKEKEFERNQKFLGG